MKALQSGIPLNTDLIDTFSIIDFLSETDFFYYPFVIDSSQLFLKYLKFKYPETLTIEAYTADADSL